MAETREVRWRGSIARRLRKLPVHIERKFYAWVTAVKLAGIRSVRERPGFHDEPLTGKLSGQRSVRLNRAYRLIYAERREFGARFLEVIRITHHEY